MLFYFHKKYSTQKKEKMQEKERKTFQQTFYVHRNFICLKIMSYRVIISLISNDIIIYMKITYFLISLHFLALIATQQKKILEEQNSTIIKMPEEIEEAEEEQVEIVKKQEKKQAKKSKSGKKTKKQKSEKVSQTKTPQSYLALMSNYIIRQYYDLELYIVQVFPKIFAYSWMYTRSIYHWARKPVLKKSKKVFYQDNFANLYGGAKIIMKSSPKIKYVNSILEDSMDKYMYTSEELPIKVIIGLNEEIAISSICIRSFEMYSSITENFQVQGSFSLHNAKWVHLGTFKAANNFEEQEFFTEKKIVRYIKIKFLSAYGKWSYFTLTQVKIRGKGLFADALTELAQEKIHEGESSTQTLLEKQSEEKDNVCPNEFKPESNLPHESNLISSLMNKIEMLESKNQIQGKQMKNLQQKLDFVTTALIEERSHRANISTQTQTKEGTKVQDKWNLNWAATLFSLFISLITMLSLLCICCLRRKELYSMRQSLHGSTFKVRKSNSNK